MENDILTLIDKCISDAKERFARNPLLPAPRVTDLAFYAFPQAWPDTAGGSGGIGGQSITSFTTVVIEDTLCRRAAVYFGRFAYMVENPGQAFYDAIAGHRMPARWQPRAHLSRDS